MILTIVRPRSRRALAVVAGAGALAAVLVSLAWVPSPVSGRRAGAALAADGGPAQGATSGSAASPQAGSGEPRAAAAQRVSALGRIEPRNGVLRVAGPSRPGVVIAKLLVERGDEVKEGQVIAELDTRPEAEAAVARARAQLANAESDMGRVEKLFREGTTSVQAREASQLKVDVARSELQAAQSGLDMAVIRAPISGRVLDVRARSGERVGPQGVVELGDTAQMYVSAEVYETDIGRVRVGQRALAKSPAFEKPLAGHVESVGLKIGKLDVTSTDPAANVDARVVEVKIKLDDSPSAAGLTNLTVEVAIEMGPS